jgi:hypothetical protein
MDEIEEAAQKIAMHCNDDFIEGAKWQAERMYSEEELREAFKQGHSSARKGSYNQITEQEDFDKWFEQFKKSNL